MNTIFQLINKILSEKFGDLRIWPEKTIIIDTTNGDIDGYSFLLFSGEKEMPECIAKLARTGQGRMVYGIEHENLVQLGNLGMNRRFQAVPVSLGKWEDEELLITIQSALPGVLMKNAPGKKLFSRSVIPGTLGMVSAWLEEFQSLYGISRVKIDDIIYRQRVLEPLNLFRNRYMLSDEDDRFLSEIFEERSSLLGQEIPFMVRHGDFCAANIMMMPGNIGVFDWEFPIEHFFPLYDLFYFFSSLRFPFSGLRGETNHIRSFQRIFWGDGYIHGLMCERIQETCIQLDMPSTLVPELFLVSLIDVANLKYRSLEDSNSVRWELDVDQLVPDHEKMKRWSTFESPDMDAPFACVNNGVFENIKICAMKGLPDFTGLRY